MIGLKEITRVGVVIVQNVIQDQSVVTSAINAIPPGEAPAPDYEAIRNAKVDMLKRFEEAKRICEAAGYVVYKKI